MQTDNVYVSLFLEKEAARIRSELLKENHALRLELEVLKTSSTVLLNEVQSRIANAEDKITEKAIDKTLVIIQQVKTWIGIAVLIFSAVFGLGALLGYKSLTDGLNVFFKDKVTHWMRFQDEDSGGRKALDELRTEVILNAYMIRLARSYSSVSGFLFPLEGPEEKRLLSILQVPDTKYSEFSDALTIIVKNRGPFRLAMPEDNIGKKIVSLLTSADITSEKKILILERLKGESALLPYSRSILSDAEYGSYMRMVAFDNVKMFDSKTAISFAQLNVGKVEPDFNKELILYIAEQSGQYDPVQAYINRLIEQKPEYWKGSVIEMVARIGETLPTTSESSASKIGGVLSQVVELGAKIEITDDRMGPKRIAIELGGGYSLLRNPGRLLKDSELIKAVITSRPLTIDWLTKSTNFFQVADQGYFLTTLIVVPNANTVIETQNHTYLSGKSVLGDIWLRTQVSPGGKELMATWRDKETGVVYVDRVIGLTDLADCDYHLSFDEKLLESLSYEYRSPTDSL